MSVHRVEEEYYIDLSIKPEDFVELVEFVDSYEYSIHEHRFECVNESNPSLTVGGFDCENEADDAECKILNFIETLEV